MRTVDTSATATAKEAACTTLPVLVSTDGLLLLRAGSHTKGQ